MHRGGPYWLPPRRAPFGRKESQPWAGVPPEVVPSPSARRPPRTPPPPRSAASFPFVEPSRHAPGSGKDRKTLGFWSWLSPRRSRLFSQQGNGDLLRSLARGSTLGRRERHPSLSPFARNRGMSPLLANRL